MRRVSRLSLAALGCLSLMAITAFTAEKEGGADKPTLEDRLSLIRTDQAQKMSPADIAKVDASAKKLKKEGVGRKAPRVGETFPDFTLPNSAGGAEKLSDLAESGPVVVTFFRGSWCPYCVAQLLHYQAHLADIEAAGGKIVAITPEEPSQSAAFAKAKGISFPLLWDENNALAQKTKIVYGVDRGMKQLYQGKGLDLEKSQGNAGWRLPVPATFVLDKNRKVVYSFVDTDFRRRAETADVVKALRKAGGK